MRDVRVAFVVEHAAHQRPVLKVDRIRAEVGLDHRDDAPGLVTRRISRKARWGSGR
jgi:hypothetical protein